MNYAKKDFSELFGTEVEEVRLQSKKPMPGFTYMWRSPFGGDGRWYFRLGASDFYSGLTGAITASNLFDKTFLNKARVNLAFQGRDADVEWRERADYGSCFHLLVSLHEMGELKFDFDNGEWKAVMQSFIESGGYQSMTQRWTEDLQNDMAAWFLFKKESNVQVIATEIMTYHDGWRVATPLDFIVEMDFNRKRITANINIKTGDKGFNDSYYFQVFAEAYLFNRQTEGLKVEGTFCWRPKDRKRSPGQYELSKNCIEAFDVELLEHMGRAVNILKTYKPNGKISTYSGGEHNFTVKHLTPYEWLEIFQQQSTENVQDRPF